MRRVYYHPRAPKEARDLLEYYSSVSGKLGDEFWHELCAATANAQRFPERHHFDATGLRRASLKRFPVHLLFRVFPDYIRVTVIRHDQRHPRYGAKRQ